MVVQNIFLLCFWMRSLLLVYKHTADVQEEPLLLHLLLTATFERRSLEFEVLFLQICPSFQRYAGICCTWHWSDKCKAVPFSLTPNTRWIYG